MSDDNTEITPQEMLETMRQQHSRIGELEVTVRELNEELDALTRKKDELTQAKAALAQRLSICRDQVKTLKEELSGDQEVVAKYLRGEANHILCVRHQVSTSGKIAVFNLLVDLSEAILEGLHERQLVVVPDEDAETKNTRGKKRRMLERLTEHRGTILGDVSTGRPGIFGTNPVGWEVAMDQDTSTTGDASTTPPPGPGKSPTVSKELWNDMINRAQQKSPLRRSNRLAASQEQAAQTLSGLASDTNRPEAGDIAEDKETEEVVQDTQETGNKSPPQDSSGNIVANSSS